MNTHSIVRPCFMRPIALLIAASLTFPLLVGCGGSDKSGANMPPVDDTRGGSVASTPPPANQSQPRTGMSTKQKVVLLAGAAALYYLYKHNKDEKGNTVQYYQSKDGRIYYREPNGRVHYVTAAPNVQVPETEAEQYRNYQGYNNNTTGQGFGGIGTSSGNSGNM